MEEEALRRRDSSDDGLSFPSSSLVLRRARTPPPIILSSTASYLLTRFIPRKRTLSSREASLAEPVAWAARIRRRTLHWCPPEATAVVTVQELATRVSIILKGDNFSIQSCPPLKLLGDRQRDTDHGATMTYVVVQLYGAQRRQVITPSVQSESENVFEKEEIAWASCYKWREKLEGGEEEEVTL